MQRLEDAGYLKEVLDSNGNIVPSQDAMIRAGIEHINAPADIDKLAIARFMTVMDLAKKYRIEMN